MAERDFLEPETKRQATRAIRGIEAGTAVEVVVAVRRRAERHLPTSLAAGLVCALATFAVMWWSPQVYDVRTMPLDALVALLLGALLVQSVPGFRQVLTPGARLRTAAERGARRAFDELGVAKTRERIGLLVYVALFERSVVLVPDQGLPQRLVEEGFLPARRALEQALKERDTRAFLAALALLGPPASAALPRKADDQNELCDDVA